MKKYISTLATLSLTLSVSAQVWDDEGQDTIWGNSTNWSADTAPTSTSNVQIGAQPTADFLTLDSDVSVASLTFNSTLTAPVNFGSLGAETLTVNGNITNADDNNHLFLIPVFTGTGTPTWSGPLTFNNIVGIGTKSVTLSGASVSFKASVNIDINTTAVFGKFIANGVTDFAGAIINFNTGTYTGGVAGDTFDFTTGSFTGATLGLLPVLTGGLQWNTSQFATTGVLSVFNPAAVPEPSTWAALAGVASLGFAALRRRRTA